MNSESSLTLPLDRRDPNMIKVQKRNKDNIKIMWHQWFNRNFTNGTGIPFVHKENKNNNFIQ